MTNVGPDLLLPGIASKKPTPAAKADGPSPSEMAAGDSDFAQELDAVTAQAPAADASSSQAPTSEAPTKNALAESNGNAPTPSGDSPEAAVVPPVTSTDNTGEVSTTPVDLAELQLFGSPQQEVVNAVSASTDIGTTTLTSENRQTDGAMELLQPSSASIGVEPSELATTETVITPGAALAVVAQSPAPDPMAIRGTAAPDNSQLLSPLAALGGSGAIPLLSQASGQIPNLIAATASNAPQPQGPNPALLAASLAIDPQGLGTTDADGDANANMQSNSKSALRAAASATPDAKPLDAAGGQTFSNTLSAAASEAANQTARSAAKAAAQRPARPAQTAPATAQVAVHIVRAVGDGVSRFNVQLQPAELGRVEVKMEISRDGAVRAMVIADRQETVDQLQRDSRALERALQDAGLKADSQNLNFSLRGGQNGHAMSENRTSIDNIGNGEADQTEVSESALAVHWSNVAGSTGALDIRV